MTGQPIESDLYIVIRHPDHNLLLRGCTFITPYRAGFEDCIYAHVYANPFPAASPQWHQYNQGNEDANVTRKLKP